MSDKVHIDNAVKLLREAHNELVKARESGEDNRPFLERELKTFIGKVDARPEKTRGLDFMNTVPPKTKKFSTTPPAPNSNAVEKLQKKNVVLGNEKPSKEKPVKESKQSEVAKPEDIGKDIPSLSIKDQLKQMTEDAINSRWTAEELTAIAKQLGVKLESATNKKQIIKAIKATVGSIQTEGAAETPSEVL